MITNLSKKTSELTYKHFNGKVHIDEVRWTILDILAACTKDEQTKIFIDIALMDHSDIFDFIYKGYPVSKE